MGVEEGAQQDRLEGGVQRIADLIADELSEQLRLGAPVRRIDHGKGTVRVFSDVGEARARRVTDFGELAEDGRLVRLTAFFRPPPPLTG